MLKKAICELRLFCLTLQRAIPCSLATIPNALKSRQGGTDISFRGLIAKTTRPLIKLSRCLRTNFQLLRRSCYFLKAAMIFIVPVARYLGLNQLCRQAQIFGCQTSQISDHFEVFGFIIGIAAFRKKQDLVTDRVADTLYLFSLNYFLNRFGNSSSASRSSWRMKTSLSRSVRF
jgi:hypothetical protein